MDSKEIAIICLYEFKLGYNAAAVTRHLSQAFGTTLTERELIYKLYEKYNSGEFADVVNYIEPSNEFIEHLFDQNARENLKKLVKKLHLFHTNISRHLAAVGKLKVMVQQRIFVVKILIKI